MKNLYKIILHKLKIIIHLNYLKDNHLIKKLYYNGMNYKKIYNYNIIYYIKVYTKYIQKMKQEQKEHKYYYKMYKNIIKHNYVIKI